MKLSGLLSALRALPEYQTEVRALTQKPRPALALNLPRAARLPVIAAMAEDWTAALLPHPCWCSPPAPSAPPPWWKS